MIPFGDIMLPVIGLVAVGLLIVGVKLFFPVGTENPGVFAHVAIGAVPAGDTGGRSCKHQGNTASRCSFENSG